MVGVAVTHLQLSPNYYKYCSSYIPSVFVDLYILATAPLVRTPSGPVVQA